MATPDEGARGLAGRSPAGSDLRASTARGMAWGAGGRVSNQVVNFAVVAILARLLDPAQFGLVAMVMVFASFALMLGDLGFGQAIIQRPDLEARHVDAAYWANLASGVALTVGFVLASPLIASYFGVPEVRLLTVVMSASFVLVAPGLVHLAVLQRDLDFRAVMLSEFTGTVIGGITAVALALGGAGVWALVSLTLVQILARTVMLHVFSSWRPQPRFDVTSLRELWRYSVNISGFRVVNYWSRTADNLIIGSQLGQVTLGLYTRAYSTMMLPMQNITRVLQQVMFPALARMQGDQARMRRAYTESLSMLATIAVPASVGLGILAEPFVLTVYGPQWSDAVILLQLLVVAGLPQTVGGSTSWVMQATGRADWLLRYGLASGVAIVVSFVVGVRWGAVGVATAYAATTLLVTPPAFMMAAHLLDARLRDVLGAMWKPFAAAAVMSGVVLGTDTALLHDEAAVLRLAIGILLGAPTYLGVLHVLEPTLASRVRAMARRAVARDEDAVRARA